MAVTPKLRGGSAADTVRAAHLEGLPKSTRKRQETGTEYEKARLREVENRCELYAVRLSQLKSNLLDAGEVREAYVAITGAIRQGIMQSRLSQKEKQEILSNLSTPAEFAANVTQRQKADSGRADENPALTASGIDQAL